MTPYHMYQKVKDFFTVPQHPKYVGAWSPLQLKVSNIISDITMVMIYVIGIGLSIAFTYWWYSMFPICNC